ncbi:MAG: amidohydrolase [Oscillospiraceae bacterium]|nr:amidohydrolase [Oscillospiraceae bacterium]
MIRFYNGRILNFTGRGIAVSNDEVHVSGDTIAYVGPAKTCGESVFEREVDLNGDLLIPGLKNAHTHSPMTFLRSLADDLPLDRWLRESCWPNEAKLDDEAVYNITKMSILEYLSSGTTAIFDMYNHSDAFARACSDCGFRAVICSGMNDFDKDPADIERDYLKLNGFGGLVSYRLGIHAEYTTGLERLKYMVSLAEKYREPCWTHLSETKSEVEGCISRYGMTPPQLLDSLGFFNYGGGGYHCVWMTDEDIALFADKGLFAVTCPSSNLKLSSGIAPVAKMLAAGVKVAIGTDSAASNNALDMFREMYLVSALQKYLENEPTACPAEDVLRMACINSALAMGLADCAGISEGMKADLVVIDLSRPNMRPFNNIPVNLIYSGSKENVRMTMVNGRILYEDGRFFIGEEAENIYEKVERFLRDKVRKE